MAKVTWSCFFSKLRMVVSYRGRSSCGRLETWFEGLILHVQAGSNWLSGRDSRNHTYQTCQSQQMDNERSVSKQHMIPSLLGSLRYIQVKCSWIVGILKITTHIKYICVQQSRSFPNWTMKQLTYDVRQITIFMVLCSSHKLRIKFLTRFRTVI